MIPKWWLPLWLLRLAGDKDLREAEQFMGGNPTSLPDGYVFRERMKNRAERERYDDTAPTYPHGDRWNSNRTLKRGVWVDDFLPTPSNRELDRFREAYWREHESIKFTLVEGEQEAPLGKDGAWIRVTARQNASRDCYISDSDGTIRQYVPTFSYGPTHQESDEGWWCRSATGSLPCVMTIVAKKRELIGASPRPPRGEQG